MDGEEHKKNHEKKKEALKEGTFYDRGMYIAHFR